MIPIPVFLHIIPSITPEQGTLSAWFGLKFFSYIVTDKMKRNIFLLSNWKSYNMDTTYGG